MNKVEFYRHHLEQEEIDSITAALGGIFLTAGPLTRRFEAEFADYLGCRAVVGVYSCTSALFLCLKAFGIGPGDEVITTPMTFVATANAVLETGARPIFVDVEPGTGNLDAERIEAAISDRTRAILPVHLYGLMCDMRRIRAIADRHRLRVIEDAAHCVEGTRAGVRPGELGDAACFSFYATKNLTSGEGGAISVNDPELAAELKLMRSHGIDRDAADRYSGAYRHWDMVRMGYKLNMFDLQAALLLPQLAKIEGRLARRREIARRYRDALVSLPGVELPREIEDSVHAHHLFTIWVDPEHRDTILSGLEAAGIGVAVNYRALHLLSYYRERFGFKPGDFPIAESIGARTISLPFYPKMSDSEVDRVIEAVGVVSRESSIVNRQP